MVKIKVTPELLRDVARQVWRVSDTLARVEVNLNRADNYLDAGNLEGNVRWRVENSIGRATSKVRQIESETNDLARELERIAGNFEQADREGLQVVDQVLSTAPSFSPQVLPATVGATGVLWQAGQIAGGGDNVPPMNSVYTGLDISDVKHVYSFFDPGIPLVGTYLSFAADDDPNRWRAAGTAFVENGLEIAIASTGFGAVVLTANAAVQFFGTAAEGSALLAGKVYGGEYEEIFFDQAESLDDNFDRIDLGNITHDVSHLAVDLFTDWDRLDDDLGDLWGHVTDLPGGLFDTVGDTVTLAAMNQVAQFDKVVSVLPLTDVWQSTVHDSAIDVTQGLADLF